MTFMSSLVSRFKVFDYGLKFLKILKPLIASYCLFIGIGSSSDESLELLEPLDEYYMLLLD